MQIITQGRRAPRSQPQRMPWERRLMMQVRMRWRRARAWWTRATVDPIAVSAVLYGATFVAALAFAWTLSVHWFLTAGASAGAGWGMFRYGEWRYRRDLLATQLAVEIPPYEGPMPGDGE